MGKQARRTPDIRSGNEYLKTNEYRMCHGEECKNVIAFWAKQKFCSRCLRKERR